MWSRSVKQIVREGQGAVTSSRTISCGRSCLLTADNDLALNPYPVLSMPSEQAPHQALVLLAHGSEELEYTTVFDLLVRAGVRVVTASVGLKEGERFVRCSRGLRIVPDGRLEDLPVRLLCCSTVSLRADLL